MTTERERILQRLSRIYCIDPNTQKELDADLLSTVADIIEDELISATRKARLQTAQEILWADDDMQGKSQGWDMMVSCCNRIISQCQEVLPISVCPKCHKQMTVVGNTTKHYECLGCTAQDFAKTIG